MIAAAAFGFVLYRQNRRSRALALRELAASDYVDVPVQPTGHARLYDPDALPHPRASDETEGRRTLEAQA